jgi:hypothetical protein
MFVCVIIFECVTILLFMRKSFYKNRGLVLILVTGLSAISVSLFFNWTIFTNNAQAATATSSVQITANVQAWLSFAVSPTSTTLTPDLVNTAGAVFIGSSSADVVLTLGTNATGGYSVSMKGTNGGLKSGTSYLISTTGTSSSSTISAGTNNYGAQGSSTGATVNPIYNYWNGLYVGSIASSTSNVFTSYTGQTASQVTWLNVVAAAASTQPAGSYTDTIILTAVTVP